MRNGWIDRWGIGYWYWIWIVISGLFLGYRYAFNLDMILNIS